MSANARRFVLLAALAFALFAAAAWLGGCSPQAAPEPGAAATPTAAPTPEVSPTPDVPPEPTPDARKEDGGAIDKTLPAAKPLPKVQRKPVQIESKDLKE